MSLKQILAVAALTALSASAMAQGQYYPQQQYRYHEPYQYQYQPPKPTWQPRAYVALDGGMSSHADLPSEVSDAGAGGLTLGYEFSPEYSVELSALDLGSRGVSAGAEFISWRSRAVTVSVIGRAAMGSGMQLTGKLGVAATSADLKGAVDGEVLSGLASATSAVVGFGVEGAFSRNLSWRANLDLYPNFAGSQSTMNMLSLGIVHRF